VCRPVARNACLVVARTNASGCGGVCLRSTGDGKAVLINLIRRVVLSHFDFKSRIHAIQFSPNGEWCRWSSASSTRALSLMARRRTGKFFAVSHHRHVRVWRSPSPFKGSSFVSLVARSPLALRPSAKISIVDTHSSIFFNQNSTLIFNV
jgi:hypothetical protein